MAASLVGTAQVSTAAAPGSSYTPTNWQVPTANNVLLMQVVCQTNNTLANATIGTPSGGGGGTWVARSTGTANGTLSQTRTSYFSMIATGGETAPSIALTNMTSGGAGILVTIIEIAGVLISPVDVNSGVLGSTSTANPLTVSSTPTATTNGHDILVAFCSLMGTGTGTPTYSWGGTGATFASLLNNAYANSLSSSVAVANTVSTGTYTATVTATSSVAQAASTMYFIGLKLANVTAAATLGETSSLGATGTSSFTGAATTAETSQLTGAIVESLPGVAAVADTSALTGAATEALPSAAVIVSASGLGGAVTAQINGAAVLADTSALTGAGGGGSTGAAVLIATSVAVASATGQLPATSALGSTSKLTGQPTLTGQAAAALGGGSLLTGNVTLTSLGSAVCAVTSALLGDAIIIQPVITPPERTYRVPAETRTYLVDVEARSFLVPFEGRTDQVEAP